MAETLTLESLQTLSNDLLSSRAHINNLPLILSALSPSAPLDLAFESLITLQSFFTPLIPHLPPSSSNSTDPETVYFQWVKSKFKEFVTAVIRIAVAEESEEDLRDVAVDAVMEFVKMGKGGFKSAIYHQFMHAVVGASSHVDTLLDLLATKYFKYIDVRYFTYTSVDKIANACESRNLADFRKQHLSGNEEQPKSRLESDIWMIFNILSRIPPLESGDKEASYEMLSQSGDISKKFKLKFTKAWLSFLKLPLPLDVYKKVLVSLRENVMPYMANPAILCDFLTSSYGIGGVISVMALSGLFTLMTQYGLEYPKFYDKLYALLTPAIFMAAHRKAFIELLDTCLKSSYLPAYIAAAFAKKLSRLDLVVPPQGALAIIAIIHNLLRRHPSINFLVHKGANDDVDGDISMEGDALNIDTCVKTAGPTHNKKHGIDPFNNEETDPSKSDAMRSSLWEVDTLRNHYCPAVSRFVASLENDLTVRAKTSEVSVADFSSGSYASIFREEMRRRIKQVPLAFYQVTPSSLFVESDFPGWSFGDFQNDKDTRVAGNGVLDATVDGDHERPKRQKIENY